MANIEKSENYAVDSYADSCMKDKGYIRHIVIFRNDNTTTFMFIVGVLFLIGGFIQFVDWIDVGIGTMILLVAFIIDMKKNKID